MFVLAVYYGLASLTERVRNLRNRKKEEPAPGSLGRTGLINPRNGHPFECTHCGDCAIFWDTLAGEQLYWAWKWATEGNKR